MEENKLWTRTIPRSNWLTWVLGLLLMFFYASSITEIRSSNSGDSMLEFALMLAYVAVGIFIGFTLICIIEQFVLKRLFARTSSPLDKKIESFVAGRNVIILIALLPVSVWLFVISFSAWGILALVMVRYAILLFQRYQARNSGQ